MSMRRLRTIEENGSEIPFRAYVVWLVTIGKVAVALQLLAKYYNVPVPKLKVGLPRRRRLRTLGCYVPEDETIYLLNSDALMNPFVILHEFYHHLRTSVDKKHRGTENYANRFAKEFIAAYQSHGPPVSKSPS